MNVQDWFKEYEQKTPEPKLELIDGRLVVGNSLAGSRYILHDLLTGWGTEAVLPFASLPLWRTALSEVFAPLAPPGLEAPLRIWQSWSEAVRFEPSFEPAGPMNTDAHHRVRERLTWGLLRACGTGGFGTSLGRDFVMRLGEDGLTADAQLIGRQASERLCTRHLNGPADLVVEVVLPGREAQDRVVKRRIYGEAGVPEYWILDPEAQTAELLRLRDGVYHAQSLDPDGRYRPASLPGLAFIPARMWVASPARDVCVFEVEAALPGKWSYQAQSGIEWDDVPFVPRSALEAGAILFEEFASWCPRAKFEGDGQRTLIGGYRGTRNVLGMFLRTFGLIETVKVLPPGVWVAGLQKAELDLLSDAKRKAGWWQLARNVAARLREECGVRRIAVIGDLTRPEPLHFWSELSLVVWDLKEHSFDTHARFQDLDSERVVDLIRPEHATGNEKRMIEEAVELS